MKEEDKQLAGLIGLGLTAALWILSSWRLVFHTLIRPRRDNDDNDEDQHQPQRQNSRKWLTRRITFHCLLWMATSLEAFAYADLSGILSLRRQNPIFSEKLGYILLDVAGRSVFELLAFCTVTGIWLHTAIQSSPTITLRSWRFRLLPSLFLAVALMLVLSSTTLAVVVFWRFRNDNLETIQNLPLSRAHALLESTAWGAHALVVLECLILTTQRITSLVPSSEWKKRLSLLSKAVLPMFLACMAYTTRCVWLIVSVVYGHQRDTYCWAWWIGFVWCPTWITAIGLLYSARKRDQPMVAHEELQQPLLAPPAEAFLAFSRHRHGGEEDLNDSLQFCRSPMPHHVFAPTNGDLEVADEETLSTDSGPTASPPATPH